MSKGVCKGCGKEREIQNKTKCWCSECVYRRSHGGKSPLEVQIEKQKIKQSQQNNTTKKKSTFSRVIKVTGEREMFLEIWEEREHFCTNPDCRKFLGHEPKTYFFSHIKPKSTHPELRLEKSNIRLLCFDCHFAVDHQGKKIRDEEK